MTTENPDAEVVREAAEQQGAAYDFGTVRGQLERQLYALGDHDEPTRDAIKALHRLHRIFSRLEAQAARVETLEEVLREADRLLTQTIKDGPVGIETIFAVGKIRASIPFSGGTSMSDESRYETELMYAEAEGTGDPGMVGLESATPQSVAPARCPTCGSDRRAQFNDGPGLPKGGCFKPKAGWGGSYDPWHDTEPSSETPLQQAVDSMEGPMREQPQAVPLDSQPTTDELLNVRYTSDYDMALKLRSLEERLRRAEEERDEARQSVDQEGSK